MKYQVSNGLFAFYFRDIKVVFRTTRRCFIVPIAGLCGVLTFHPTLTLKLVVNTTDYRQKLKKPPFSSYNIISPGLIQLLITKSTNPSPLLSNLSHKLTYIP